MFPADGGAGAAGDGYEPGVGRQVARGGEGGGAADFEQDVCAGPDATPGMDVPPSRFAGERCARAWARVCESSISSIWVAPFVRWASRPAS